MGFKISLWNEPRNIFFYQRIIRRIGRMKREFGKLTKSKWDYYLQREHDIKYLAFSKELKTKTKRKPIWSIFLVLSLVMGFLVLFR